MTNEPQGNEWGDTNDWQAHYAECMDKLRTENAQLRDLLRRWRNHRIGFTDMLELDRDTDAALEKLAKEKKT